MDTRKHYIHGMNHKNLMISMEILVTAFKSPFVMSLIAQSNNHTLRSERGVVDLQTSSITVHLPSCEAALGLFVILIYQSKVEQIR